MVRTTESDEGKKVVRGDETVGRVVDVKHGTPYVDPDPGITDTLKSKLGWAEADEDAYPLQDETIEEVTDDEIRIRTTM